MSMAETRARPLSPHLQIYRPMLTMLMSIAHRVTGAALYFGALLVAWWLIAAASGPNYYAAVQWFMGTIVGRLVLFGYTWALIHHMLGGVRHLIWDTGRGLGPAEREWLARATLFGSIGVTALLWIAGGAIGRGSGARGVRVCHELGHAGRGGSGAGLGQIRYPAFLAPAPDFGGERAAVDLLRRAGGLPDRPQSRGRGADHRLARDPP